MRLRPFISLILALMLVLTSQSMAVARGAAAATGQMVLCTGAGPVAIYTDAEGKPTAAPHICPDAALNILAGVALPDLTAPATLAGSDLALRRFGHVHTGAPQDAPNARGPPLSV